MQAITTLHAQLCLATEKLDLAQKSLITQKKAIHDLEEEGRMMLEEIDDLKEMLDNVELSQTPTLLFLVHLPVYPAIAPCTAF